MPGIPTNFPKPTVLVHPPMRHDTRDMWVARNADFVRIADAFFAILADAKSAKEVKYRAHHRDTWHGTDLSDWLYSTAPYGRHRKIGQSTCSAYEVHNSNLDVAAELFTLNSKRLQEIIVKLNGESIDLTEHSARWHFNGRHYEKVGSLLNNQQRWHLSLLTKKCMPKVGEENSRQFAMH